MKTIRCAIRAIIRYPLFSFAVIFILTLGIAANTSIFSIIRHALFSPIASPEPERLMIIENAYLSSSMDGMPSLASPMLDWAKFLQSFESLSAYRVSDGGLNFSVESGGREPERIEGIGVSSGFFSTFKVAPVLGRAFVSEEEEPGRNRVLVLNHSFWQKRFGADGEIVGKTVLLNEVPFLVIGVASAEFRFPLKADVWIPISYGKDRIFTNMTGVHKVIGRLKPGISAAQAQQELNAIRQRFSEENSDSWLATKELRIIPLLDKVTGDLKLSLLLLWGAVGLVQMIVCANVANLLLARGITRSKEIAIRAALGASNRTLFGQLLTESLILSVISGIAGLIGSFWFLKLISIYTPTSIISLNNVSLDMYAVTFTLGLSLLTGIALSLAPGFQAMRVDIDQTLKEGGSRSNSGTRLSGLRNFLVILEIALALSLLIGAGLLIESFRKVLKIESGIDATNVLTISISPSKAMYPDANKVGQLFNDLILRLRRHPSIRSVGAVNFIPMSKGDAIALLFEIFGQPQAGKFQERFARDLAVTPDYFSSIGIPLIEGRFFNEYDTANSKPVIIINQSFARRFWPNESAIGKLLLIAGKDSPAEIVGVVGDVRYFGPEGKSMFDLYSSYLQSTSRLNTFVIKTDSDPLKLASIVRQEVRNLDPKIPVYDIKTMEQRIDESTGNRRFITFVLGIFSIIAIILAGSGIYGVMAYSVSQQTHEIGIRMAFGADQRQILGLIIWKALKLTLFGVAAGITTALLLTRFMASLLYDLKATDIVTFSITALAIITIALLASFLPAYRATKVDPLVALRRE